MIKHINKNKKDDEDWKKLPNILSLDDDKWNCNILFRTMMAMNNQESACRKELMGKLYELYQGLY